MWHSKSDRNNSQAGLADGNTLPSEAQRRHNRGRSTGATQKLGPNAARLPPFIAAIVAHRNMMPCGCVRISARTCSSNQHSSKEHVPLWSTASHVLAEMLTNKPTQLTEWACPSALCRNGDRMKRRSLVLSGEAHVLATAKFAESS